MQAASALTHAVGAWVFVYTAYVEQHATQQAIDDAEADDDSDLRSACRVAYVRLNLSHAKGTEALARRAHGQRFRAA